MNFTRTWFSMDATRKSKQPSDRQCWKKIQPINREVVIICHWKNFAKPTPYAAGKQGTMHWGLCIVESTSIRVYRWQHRWCLSVARASTSFSSIGWCSLLFASWSMSFHSHDLNYQKQKCSQRSIVFFPSVPSIYSIALKRNCASDSKSNYSEIFLYI